MREPVGGGPNLSCDSMHQEQAKVAHNAKVTGGRDRKTFPRTPQQREGRERFPVEQSIMVFTARGDPNARENSLEMLHPSSTWWSLW